MAAKLLIEVLGQVNRDDCFDVALRTAEGKTYALPVPEQHLFEDSDGCWATGKWHKRQGMKPESVQVLSCGVGEQGMIDAMEILGMG